MNHREIVRYTAHNDKDKLSIFTWVCLHRSSLDPSSVRTAAGGLELWTVLIPVQDVPGIRRPRHQQRQAIGVYFQDRQKAKGKATVLTDSSV